LKGTSSAKSVTLSFWCRCTKTGNIQVNLYDWDNTRIIGQAVSINSADTWEYKTLTFVGDTSGVLGNDNGASLVLEWWLDKGSNFSGGAVPTSWEALNNADRAAGCTLALGDSTSNDFYLTGVQLELGSVATPFEHRSYGEELRRCLRYYYRHAPVSTYTGYLVTSAYSSTASRGSYILPEIMRALPTFANSGSFQSVTGVSIANGDIYAADSGGHHNVTIHVNVTDSGVGVGYSWHIRAANDNTAYWEFTAEL